MMKHVDMAQFCCKAENVNDHFDAVSGDPSDPSEPSDPGDMAAQPDVKRVKSKSSRGSKASSSVCPADVPIFAKIVRRVDEAVNQNVLPAKKVDIPEEKHEKPVKQDGNLISDTTNIESLVKQLVEKELVNRIEEIRMLVRCVVNGILDEELRKPKKKPHGSRRALSIFLQENQKYVLPIVKEAITGASDMRSVFQTVIRTIWFHADHAENHIVYIPPNAYNSITVHKERGWCNYEMAQTLRAMIQRANDVLQEFTIGISDEDESKLVEEFGPAKYKKLQEFTDKVDNMDDDQSFYKRLIKDTENTILTSQHLVHGGLYE